MTPHRPDRPSVPDRSGSDRSAPATAAATSQRYASPLFADLAGLPPLLIQAGGDETMLDDATLFAAAAARMAAFARRQTGGEDR